MLHCSAARGKKAALVPKEGRLVCECYTVWCTSAGRFFDACVSFFAYIFGAWARIRLLLVLERRVVAGPRLGVLQHLVRDRGYTHVWIEDEVGAPPTPHR